MYTVPPTYIQGSAQLAPVSTTAAGHLAQVVVGVDHGLLNPALQCQPRYAGEHLLLDWLPVRIFFPYVVSQNGLETGIAISNTSADPYGTAPQAAMSSCSTILTMPQVRAAQGSFFTTPPATITAQTAFTQTTATQVTSGGQLLMVAGSGSSNPGETIKGVPGGTNGYLIAVTGFQYCHAFAFISDTQVQKLAEVGIWLFFSISRRLWSAPVARLVMRVSRRRQVNGESLGH